MRGPPGRGARGGYSEASVPFLGLAIIEALSGERTEVVDPTLGIFDAQQPQADTVRFQLDRINALARTFADAAAP